MAADMANMDAARGLEPDDVVGNALCDALLATPDPSVIRVLNAHGEWCEAAPSVQDYIRTLERVPSVVARWPAPNFHGTDTLVYADGGIRRVRESDSPTATAEIITPPDVRRLVDIRGQPELVPREDSGIGGGADE